MPVNIKVKGNIQNLKKKEKNEKILSSNFLLTINTNQRYGDDDEDLENDIEVFDETIKEILNRILLIPTMLIIIWIYPCFYFF